MICGPQLKRHKWYFLVKLLFRFFFWFYLDQWFASSVFTEYVLWRIWFVLKESRLLLVDSYSSLQKHSWKEMRISLWTLQLWLALLGLEFHFLFHCTHLLQGSHWNQGISTGCGQMNTQLMRASYFIQFLKSSSFCEFSNFSFGRLFLGSGNIQRDTLMWFYLLAAYILLNILTGT